jgi:O-antigen/teichoic acid export membrane protein
VTGQSGAASAKPAPPGPGNTGKSIRGSALLLLGRLLSKLLNFGVQVAIVRLLTKDDFGAFAYGLGLAMAGELLVKLGLGKASNRFVPMYLERGDGPRVMGTLVTLVSFIVVSSAVGWLGLWQLSLLENGPLPTGDAARVVLILALLAPIQALDAVSIQTLASFSKPREIFFRKHLVGPLLRVVAVGVVWLAGGSSVVLAWAWVGSGALGLALCARLVLRALRQAGLLAIAPARWSLEARELFRHAWPLVSSDLFAVSMTAITTVLLLAMSDAAEVASVRAVLPAAVLNLVVFQSFTILYTPGASRLMAAGRGQELGGYHWKSSVWVAVLSFPVFALTFGIAPALVPLLFGEQYRDAAGLLAVLALGEYVPVCLAFGAEALQVAGLRRAIVTSNLLGLSAALSLALALIPSEQALGAALAVAAGRMLAAASRQRAVARSGIFGVLPAYYRAALLRLVAATAATVVVGWVWRPGLAVECLVLALVSCWLLRTTSHALDVRETFPEVLRVPYAHLLFPSRRD